MTSSTSLQTSFWTAIERARIHRGAQDSLSEQMDADAPRGTGMAAYRRGPHCASLRSQASREADLASAHIDRAQALLESSLGVVSSDEFERMENALRGL